MKLKVFILLTLATMLTSGWQATAQTNGLGEFRMVLGKVYDINNSPEWKTITIPQLAAINNSAQLRFDGTIRPQMIIFQIPGVYNFTRPVDARIDHYPYSPNNFIAGYYQNGIGHQMVKGQMQDNVEMTAGMLVPKTLRIRVFPLSQARTNWDAYGHGTIIPARPEFDYGVPVTNAMVQTDK